MVRTSYYPPAPISLPTPLSGIRQLWLNSSKQTANGLALLGSSKSTSTIIPKYFFNFTSLTSFVVSNIQPGVTATLLTGKSISTTSSSGLSGSQPSSSKPSTTARTLSIPKYLFMFATSSSFRGARSITVTGSKSNSTPSSALPCTSYSTWLGHLKNMGLTELATTSTSSSGSSSTSITDYLMSMRGLDKASQFLHLVLPSVELLHCDDVTPLPTPVELGRGSYGKVELMTTDIGGTDHLVAVKTAFLDKHNDPNLVWKQMCLEARAMAHMSEHPLFPRVYGVFRKGNICSLVQEFAGNKITQTSSTFHSVLFKAQPAVKGLDCINLSLEAAGGLHFIHLRGLLHNDFAARNILIIDDGKQISAKVTDFGMVTSIRHPRRWTKKTFQTKTERDTYLANHKEIAPERIIVGAPMSVQTDVYALGNFLRLVAKRIKNTKMRKVADACLCYDPTMRLSMDSALDELTDIFKQERLNPVSQDIVKPWV